MLSGRLAEIGLKHIWIDDLSVYNKRRPTFPFSVSLLERMHSTRLRSSLHDMVCMELGSVSSCTFLEKRLTARARSFSERDWRTWCTRSASVLYASGLKSTNHLWSHINCNHRFFCIAIDALNFWYIFLIAKQARVVLSCSLLWNTNKVFSSRLFWLTTKSGATFTVSILNT